MKQSKKLKKIYEAQNLSIHITTCTPCVDNFNRHRIFWDSKFSHKSNIEFWKKQIKTGAKYPLVKLKQLTTLEKVIQSL